MSQYQVSSGWKKKLVPFLVVLLGILAFVAWNKGWIKGRRTNAAEVVHIDDVAGKYVKEAPVNVPKVPLPSGEELDGKTFATFYTYDWQANTGLIYANGGERTLEGSLLGNEGVVLKILHQDDTNVTIKAFLAKAAEFKTSGGASGGNVIFTIMGNATVALTEPIQASLKAIDPSYRAVAIDLLGKSDGEDQVIAPAEWASNPDSMRGKTIIGVWDDGDIFEAVMYVGKLGVPVNFDYHTYNPNALNIEAAGDFLKAEKTFLNVNQLDSRPIVDDQGRRTGKTTNDLGIILRPDALASWTPADRDLVAKLSQTNPDRLRGLVTLVSTGAGEERKIMPCVLIALNKWADQNQSKLVKISYAAHKAASQIDAYPDALQRAMEINNDLLGIWDDSGDAKSAADERARAFKGYAARENPKLHVGGSAVFSFKDAMNMVGMTDAGDDIDNSTLASVHRSFGNLVVKKYPEKEIKTFTPFDQFFDSRILRAAYNRAKSEGISSTELVQKRTYDNSTPTSTLGSTSYRIEFESGSAQLTSSAVAVLQEIQDAYAASEFPITVVGHTDRTGTDAVNGPLSLSRADAVKNWLLNRNNRDFGGNRITTDGKGSSQPPAGVDQNYAGACSSCRRVEIVIHR